MIMQKVSKLLPTLLGVLCLYSLGYAYARMSIFHAVENYTGAEGKAGARQDYIAKKDRTPGEGWEYQLFLPAIKVEESIINYFHNL
ncbi:hypothetical protein NIES22_47950 [Calothrix brevissima NIES-22]|nr:hypothetical protein NIES22_47950 [Calothrix brevissima NIES-22]